jgi:hypothetical protein
MINIAMENAKTQDEGWGGCYFFPRFLVFFSMIGDFQVLRLFVLLP